MRMEKLCISCFGIDIYIDGSKDDAERINDKLKSLIENEFIRPDFHYKAKAKGVLGLS